MAEIVKIVRKREGLGVECQICHFPWTPHDLNKLPRRCANPRCRTMRWDAEKYPNAGPPRPPHGGANVDSSANAGIPGTNYRTLQVPLTARKPAVPVSDSDQPDSDQPTFPEAVAA